ncbi:MAG: OmpA family protein [Sedimentisphaerales bacterium]|nr:OmpA family protein [Sedimentisphaerales bacterium]
MKRLNLVFSMLVMGFLVFAGGCCQECQQQADDCLMELEGLQAGFDASQEALMQCRVNQDELRSQLAAAQRELRACQTSAAQQPEEPTFSGEQSTWDANRGTLTVTVASDVLFDSGSADLLPAAQQRLRNIVTVINRDYANKEISVVGYTDTDPIRQSGWDDNWELSCERALAVTRYLIEAGVAPVRLAAAGRGEFHPLGTRQQSRRVEIVVHMY